MKTLPRTLFILSGAVLILTAAFCLADPIKPTATATIEAVETSVGTAPQVSSSSATGVYLTLPTSEDILEISGIDSDRVGESAVINHVYRRPEKIENVRVFVWTADGRKWVANWTPAKQ